MFLYLAAEGDTGNTSETGDSTEETAPNVDDRTD